MLKASYQCSRQARVRSLHSTFTRSSLRTYVSYTVPHQSNSAQSKVDQQPESLTAIPLNFSHLLNQSSRYVFSQSIARFAHLLRTVPKGFGNFDPDQKKPSNSDDSNKQTPSDEPSNQSESPKDKSDKSSKSESSNKEPKPDKDSKSDKKSSKKKKPEDEQTFSLFKIVNVALGLGIIYIWLQETGDVNEITFQEFRNRYLETGKVSSLIVDGQNKTVTIAFKPEATSEGDSSPAMRPMNSDGASGVFFRIGSVEAFERSLIEAQNELGLDPHDHVQVKYRREGGGAAATIGLLLQIGLFGLIGYSVWRGMSSMGGMGGIGPMGGGKGGKGIFSVGKSPAVMIKPGESAHKVTFNDVAGLDEAKVEVMEFVKFLKAPEQFTRLGAKIPKGALLVGPPGTGKTLLAKAMAGEASVPFFSISGSDFIEMFVGVGPSRVRDLFSEARKHAPCIIFIDEIDAVGRARGKGQAGGHDERENTLNQLLVEMDGFSTTEGVVVLAGTNRKDILDKALLRPGRFDRQILIDKPDLRGRTQIFGVHLKPLKTNHDVNDLAARLAALTPGFAGADIANLCNEAALIAARSNKDFVELVDFEKATDRIIGGLEKQHNLMSQAERKRVAYHEAGHAVIGWFLEHADPLLKVTIVPRGNGALGFAQYLPKELSLYTSAQLLDMMCMTLGGRAAEQHFFDLVSSGAADDLSKVTRIAQAQIVSYGMSAKLGQVSYHHDDEQQFTKPFSEATAQTIDEEVRALIATAYQRTQELIVTHAEKVEALAKELLELETINHDVIVRVLGPRPFTTDAYSAFIKHQQEAARLAAEKKEQEAKAKNDDENKTESTDDQSPILTPI